MGHFDIISNEQAPTLPGDAPSQPLRSLLPVLVLLLIFTGCTKVDYNSVPSPSYLRVFNSLNYTTTIANKDQPPPFLTMVIDPTYDSASHVVTGGSVVGDFLDARLGYAPPAPNNAGSTSLINNEYPGNAKVLTAPILNGFDLSSWAEIISGKHRFVFYSRPRNQTAFFQLPAASRTVVLADSTINMIQGEIYTMEVLQPDAYNSHTQLYIRQEQFQHQAFADSLLYVNFYNLSSANYMSYAVAAALDAPNAYNNTRVIRDTMNVYYSLFQPDNINGPAGNNYIPGYKNIYLTSLIRSLQPSIAPYFSIPLFAAADTTGGILSQEWELFTFLSPAYQMPDNPFSSQTAITGSFSTLQCTDSYYWLARQNGGSFGTGGMGETPNLAITTASGKYHARSFATVSTVEYINSQVYVMSVQRVYAPPTGD
jgi:hypothetical protein